MFRFFENAVDPFPPEPVRALPADVRRFLTREFRPLRAVVLLCLLSTVINAGFEVGLIWYSGRLVDVLATAPPGRLWATHGAELLAVAVTVIAVRPLAHLFSEALDDIAFRANAQALARWRAHRYVSRQSVGWFRNDFAGRIASWVRDGGAAAGDAAYNLIHTLAFVGTYIIGSTVLMASLDVRLLLPVGVWIVLYAGLAWYVVPRFRVASARVQEANSELTGLLVDSYTNIDTLALFADRGAEDREALRVFGATRRAFLRMQRLEVTMNAAMMFLDGILMVGLVGYGLVLWRSGSAPLGLIASALALSFRISSMAEWLLDGVSGLFRAVGALRRSLQTIARPLVVADRPGAGALAVRGGRITFTEVSHHYGKGSGGLDRFCLQVAAGEKVGLVGRSGAGKSTVVNLLLRFFDPERGLIAIDGQDVTAVTQDSLRSQIAMVTQEAMLLHRSVRDNISSGDGGMERIEAAARAAAADGFLAGLRDPDGRTGYAARVGERGVMLSGGQRQRIAIARAIHKDAPILVLDEATSALDSEVEAAIQDSLDEVVRGRTVIAIAHRLSTIARMDRIVVLDRGRVVEQGTHAQLLEGGGLYAALWARQSGGFLGLDPQDAPA